MAEIEPYPVASGSGLDEKGFHPVDQIELKKNLDAKIRNPLEGIPKAQLMADVEDWCHRHSLTSEVAIFKRGALVAQNPTSPEAIDGDEKLNTDELDALEYEIRHKWHMPLRLFLTIAICSIGAAVQGWDQTGANGAALWFPDYYGLGDDTRGKILQGLIISAPYIGSAFIGCWLADPCNNYIGRRGTIFVAGHFCLWPVIGSAFCQTWPQQLVCRLLMGMGMGIKASTVPVYAAENAPANIRGALVMSWQFWTAFGIMLGTVINLAVYHVDTINWRLMFGAPFIPAVPLVALIYFCPESPRWLMKKGRYAEAWKSMNKLRFHSIQVARDMYYISAQLEIEHQIMGRNNYVTRFTQLFTIPRVRRANLAAWTVMLAQQMCGINIIAFYSTSIFSDAGLSDFQAMLGSFGFGLVNWLFCFPAFWTIDTFGRRSLLLFTFPQMFWTLLAAGLCTLLDDSVGTTRTALVCLFVYLFAAFYSPGEGPVPFTYSAEVYPLSHRETGMGFAVATCLGWASVLSITLPFLLDKVQAVGVFAIYAGLNVVAFIMILFWVPETMRRTLEELDWVFAVPTSTFMKYQITDSIPYFFKRWVLWRRSAKLRPLYQFENVADTAKEAVVHRENVATHSSEDDKKVVL